MDRPDASRPQHVSDDSDDTVLLALTEEERLHGLDLFADEPPRIEPRQVEQSQIYERVPAHAGRIAPPDRRLERATSPVPPDVRRVPPRPPVTWRSPILYAPLLAAVLAAVVVVYAVIAGLMRPTAADQIATVDDQIAERSQAARIVPELAAVAAVPATAAVAVLPSSETLPVADAPASHGSAEPHDGVAAAQKVTPAVSVSSAGTAAPLPILESAIAPLLAAPALPASLPVEPRPVVAVPAALPRAEATAAPVPRMPAPETAIETVLSQYRTAYRDLDTGAARAVWPSVDTKALRKAFDRLEQQDLIFNSCQIAVSDVRAVASCSGFAWYVPRVGNKSARDDQRQWEFKLSKVDDVWLIDTVSAR